MCVVIDGVVVLLLVFVFDCVVVELNVVVVV